MSSPGSIFISYRRSDSISETGRIYDYLESHFGRQRVFKDVDSIPLGVNFREYLDQEVGRCQVLVAVIGPEWLTVRGLGLELSLGLGRGRWRWRWRWPSVGLGLELGRWR